MSFQGLFVYTILIGIMELFAINLAKDTPYITYSNGRLKEKTFFRWEIITPILIFSIVLGMRWNVGWDHIPYLFAYIQNDIERFEFGFKFITSLFQKANIHYVLYFTLWAFLQIYFFLLSFKKEYYLFPFLIIFIFTQSEVSFWINGIRQALSMCFILYSITFIDKKKPVYYILLSIIAVSFHRSAIIIVIILYPLLVSGKCYFRKQYLQYFLLILAFIGRTIIYNHIEQFEIVLEFYNELIGYAGTEVGYTMEQLSAMEKENSIGFVYIIRLLVILIIIAFSTKMRLFYSSRWFNIIYNLFFIGALFTYLAPGNINNIDRLFRYFYIYKPIMISYLCYYLYKCNNTNKMLSYVIISLDILGWFGANIKNGWSFEFFFQHEITDIMYYLN